MKAFLFFAVFLSSWLGFAQQTVPILERKISIELSNEPLPSALDRIGRQGGFSFSYNSSIISASQVVTIEVSQKTVREILNQIFKGTIQYKEKAKHLILTQAPISPKVNNTTTTVLIISGYVEDEVSGAKISDASVYEKETLTSAVTDQYGFYKIKLDHVKSRVDLYVRKMNYRDTIVSISAAVNEPLNISIKPITKDSVVIVAQVERKDSVVQEKKKTLAMPYESDANIQNIHDTLYRKAQISFLPFLGTNGKLSGNVINDYSFNILGGYSLGTRMVEVAGYVNIDRGDVGGLQLAGFGNLVGRSVQGVQGAGLFNINGGVTHAVQLVGFLNLNFGKTRGVQLAGFANTNLNSTHGVQLAGFSNFSKGPSMGTQVAGIGNVQLGDYKGSQFAGFANVNTKKINGTQLSGFANIATGHVEGLQASGFFNYGKNVSGVQIALINVADSLTGVPVGLISYVDRGYHKLELSGDEIFFTNVSFRTGVQQFYNIISAGIKPRPGPDNVTVWTFGYGLGTARKITRSLYFNFDVTSQQINKGSFTHALSLLNKVHMGLDFQVSRKISIYAGGTLNGYLTEKSFTDYPDLFTDSGPHIFYDNTVGDVYNLKMWFGWKAGVRFF